MPQSVLDGDGAYHPSYLICERFCYYMWYTFLPKECVQFLAIPSSLIIRIE